jgi:transposase InsO family protein
LVSPARRRAAVARLVRRFKVSERRACRVVGQHRSSQRYAPVPADFEVRLVAAMVKVADAHPRWGYRRVHAALVGDGWEVNVKRVERLWRREGLRVPPPRSKASGQKALGHDEHALWMLPATRPGHVWSYDFMSLRTGAGTRLRVLNVVDEFTRVCVGSAVHYSIGATEVRRTMEGIFAVHGRPAIIRSDNGREFIATGLLEWLREQGVDPIQVAKASPQQMPGQGQCSPVSTGGRYSHVDDATRCSWPGSSDQARTVGRCLSGRRRASDSLAGNAILAYHFPVVSLL